MIEPKFPSVVNARPTKDLFIDMLVKDIPLTRAILDFVDNSVDGARHLKGEGDYQGLTVKIEADPHSFRIEDNCGGFDVNTAAQYAFRFGRPRGSPSLPNSLGQFGVGMKRALFKLGRQFVVESATEQTYFRLAVDVDDWKRKEDEWEFTFDEVGLNTASLPPGTTIAVKALLDPVSEDFGQKLFLSRLAQEISEAHQFAINQGLSISLNATPLRSRPLQLLRSDKITPAYQELSINGKSATPVHVRMHAGIHKRTQHGPAEAGWYVYCNGRLVVGADQSSATGWGEGGESRNPRYHNQYSMFRGYTFFTCEDASRLPWNTTKTGVDTDSPVLRAAKLEMVSLMRPVIDFLNRLDAEKESAERSLETACATATYLDLSQITEPSGFLAPTHRPRPRTPRTRRISYSKPTEHVDKAAEVLGVSTSKEVGEKTFDYFFKRECRDP